MKLNNQPLINAVYRILNNKPYPKIQEGDRLDRKHLWVSEFPVLTVALCRAASDDTWCDFLEQEYS